MLLKAEKIRARVLSILLTVTLTSLACLATAVDRHAKVKQYKGPEGVGILLEESDDFGAVVANHPENKVFYIKPGEYRGQRIIPSANGQKFIGLAKKRVKDKKTGVTQEKTVPKPVLNGSVVLRGWDFFASTPDGLGIWRVHYVDDPPWYRTGDCVRVDDPNGSGWGVPASMGGNLPCTFPQVLFVTDPGQGSPQVWWRWRTLEELNSETATNGSWYYDSENDYVYVKADLNMNSAGRTVEISRTRFAFGYDETVIHGAVKRSDIVIKNLVIEKYANPGQTGAIGYYRPGDGWIIENCEVRYNHGIGVKFSGPAVIRNNDLHHNGQFGIAAGDGDPLNSESSPSELSELNRSDGENRGWADGYAGSGAQVLNNMVAYNRLRGVGFASGWGAGGAKFSLVSNLLVKGNTFLGNDGPAIWLDFAEDNNVIEWNHSERNAGPGIFIELSGSVRRNNSALEPEQIPMSEAKPTLVRNNFVAFNGHGPNEATTYPGGINVSSSNRVTVSGNIVISDGQGNGGHGVMMTQVQDAGTPTVQSPGTQVIVNRHVEYINVYSRYNDISDNDIVYTTATGLSGAAGFFEQAYKVIKDEGYPFGERLFWADADLPDDWNFFGTQDGQPNATPKPFQKNRYHLVSGELHWSWDNTGDGWPETISLADFKEQDLDKDATIDGNIDYRYWFEKWNTGRTAFHASGDGDN